MADTAPIERASCVAVELVAHEATEGAREGGQASADRLGLQGSLRAQSALPGRTAT